MPGLERLSGGILAYRAWGKGGEDAKRHGVMPSLEHRKGAALPRPLQPGTGRQLSAKPAGAVTEGGGGRHQAVSWATHCCARLHWFPHSEGQMEWELEPGFLPVCLVTRLRSVPWVDPGDNNSYVQA